MEQVKKFRYLSELIWWMITILMIGYWYIALKGEVNNWVHVFFSYNIAVSMLYFGWFIQVHHSPVVRSFWVKMGLILLNFPLFFFLYSKSGYFVNIFDAYQYIPNDATSAYILIQEPVEKILFIKRWGVFWSTAAVVMTVLSSFRFLFYIFKYRQVPFSSTGG